MSTVATDYGSATVKETSTLCCNEAAGTSRLELSVPSEYGSALRTGMRWERVRYSFIDCQLVGRHHQSAQRVVAGVLSPPVHPRADSGLLLLLLLFSKTTVIIQGDPAVPRHHEHLRRSHGGISIIYVTSRRFYPVNLNCCIRVSAMNNK